VELLAASGCRISEALTVLWDDIHIDTDNPKNNKVFIVDPDTRLDVLIQYIPEHQLKKLDHKGRVKPDTFLIQPFASMFWHYLGLYDQEQRALEASRHRPVAHRFLFRNSETAPWRRLIRPFTNASVQLHRKLRA